MEFQFETLYDHVGLTAMAKALRKIYRRKKSLITKIIGIVLFLVGLYFSTPLGGRELKITPNSLITYISLAMLLIVILFEDAINGFGAMKRLVDGREEAISTFEEDFYTVKTDLETRNLIGSLQGLLLIFYSVVRLIHYAFSG